MNSLWILWVIYVLGFFADFLYIQPYRRRRAAENRLNYKAGSISFGLRAALPIFTAVLVVRTFVIDVYRIPTPSMEPNLPQGTTIWVNRLAFGLRSPVTGAIWLAAGSPQPGEIIVFQYPREPRTTYVKRVLGVPGDHIRIVGDRIERNGEVIYDPSSSSISEPTHVVRVGSNDFPILDDPLVDSTASVDIRIPEGHFFALGDNIDHSEDSRVWGLLSTRHLIGRVNL
jgi:signal peptidase I